MNIMQARLWEMSKATVADWQQHNSVNYSLIIKKIIDKELKELWT